MTPWFVLARPRSRTAWLSVFLQGAGVPCLHEGWKYATTAQELRRLMQEQGDGPVVNSDCSNIFFLEDLRQEFPEAKYLVIDHDEPSIVNSLKSSYGDVDYTDIMRAYRQAFASVPFDPQERVDCRTWDHEASRRLVRTIAGRDVSPVWLEQITGMLVQLMPEQIERDIQRSLDGELFHVHDRVRRMAWASLQQG